MMRMRVCVARWVEEGLIKGLWWVVIEVYIIHRGRATYIINENDATISWSFFQTRFPTSVAPQLLQ